MKATSITPLFLLIIRMLLLVRTLGHDENVKILQSCLTDHKVKNFSLYNDSSAYFTLLDFSIQNLRFAGPTVPKPAAISVPMSKEEIVDCVLCSRKGLLEIRVRSGGHSYEGSSYTVSDGSQFVLIDMMALDRVSVDLKGETAWVEGGATLGQVYYSIYEASRVHGFSAGSCPTVGVSGHFGGGGFGLLSRKYGLAADNVVDALVVDAKGRLLSRATMGEDVFWAIQGGGGGVWGIVYAWKIHLVKVPENVTCFGVSKKGTGSSVMRLINKWQRVVPWLQDEFYLSLSMSATSTDTKDITILTNFRGFYLANKIEVVTILKRVSKELGISEEDVKEMSWIESILYFSGLPSGSLTSALKDRYHNYKDYFKAKSDYVRTPISLKGIASLVKALAKEPKGYVMFNPYGGAMAKISNDSIAFPHRKGNLYAMQYMVEWEANEKGRSADYMKWIRGLYKSMTPYVSSYLRAAYVNYVDYDLGVMDKRKENLSAVKIAKK